ncbi:unnamed protein product [Cladocopium goreaui]|uniref:Uncharacterized protein n=1 Tax=Cladocopium goreaui TaxID=2562237 RepID=A0A9P1FI28_9DINO|nr:unnamed protein product [Cladocopium goreaui]CAI3978229.1 unnamed protein product [Cladocopium goreaui]|mmetsp:Transcript_66842/g.146534  ORF Transcript_66842/g.146534 Transcript_66842/m.146534 type:complete len:170 (+) Transcript_66842:44-553(+)
MNMFPRRDFSRCSRVSLAMLLCVFVSRNAFCQLEHFKPNIFRGSVTRCAHPDEQHTPSEPSELTRQSSSSEAGRRYDFEEYRGVYRRLISDESWPRVLRIVVVGPSGETFRRDVQESVFKVLGWDPITVTVDERTRWQSVKLDVRFITPDDFCALHSDLQTIQGVQSVL